MQKWEYRARVWKAQASVEDPQYLANKYPDWTPSRNSPEHLERLLDKCGDDGWELVSMRPVAEVGYHDDIRHPGEIGCWSAWYFLVFKRPKS